MIDIIKGFNSQDWRFNRFKFWVHTLIMEVTVFLLSLIIWLIWGKLGIEFLSQLWSLLWWLWIIYIMFTSYIKRLHDLDKSGWMSLLILIPLVNIYIFVICGFFKWTEWTNKYGPDPLVWANTKTSKSWTPNEL